MKSITVFTPTFNRAHLLPRLYESLCNQSSKDFVWLIIDDGSSDGTEELVKEWMNQNKIEIQYHWKKNGGMHTGHNAAYERVETPLCMCVDSDDYLLDDSVERILRLAQENQVLDNPAWCGMIGLNVSVDGTTIGRDFPFPQFVSTYQDLSAKYKAIGDKKIVFKTACLQALDPYPTFEGERFVPLYHPIVLDQSYQYLCFNEYFCVVEYQNDGSTINIYNQYFNNPKGFRHLRAVKMEYQPGLRSQFISAVHLVSSNIILGDKWTKGSPLPVLTTLAIPFGWAWYTYLKYKRNNKRDIKKYVKA